MVWREITQITGGSIAAMSFESLATMWLCEKKYEIHNVVHAAALWVIWNTRNDLAFNRTPWIGLQAVWRRMASLLPFLRSHKRKVGCHGRGAGTSSTSASPFMLAGSWLNLQVLTRADLNLAQGNPGDDEDLAWKISTEGLAKRLRESNLKLVEDGTRLKVVDL